jgi:cobalt-zinc-cadmium efflux system outer membrane protein
VVGQTPFSDLYELGATYAQTIELGGKRRLRGEVGDHGVAVAEAQLADVLRQRLVEVKRAFYEAVLARHLLENALDNQRVFDDLIRFNETRFREGAISEGELVKVRLERVRFDTAVSHARLAARQAVVKLLGLLNETDFPTAASVAGDLTFTPAGIDLASLREAALHNAPALRIATRNVGLAASRLELERARSSADIAPFVGFKQVGPDSTVLFGVSVPLPIFNRNQGGVARAAADEDVAKTELALARTRVLTEVESAYEAWQTAREQVQAFQHEVLPQADESREIALAAYREGAIELLGLLEAERTRADVRQQYYRALFEYENSLLMLEAAVGPEVVP